MIEAQAQEDLKIAESVFRLHTNGVRSEWRSTLAGPTDALAQASRAADVIVAGGSVAGRGDGDRVADTAQIAIQSARPVLVTPNSGGELQGRRIVLAWKDTREARRAVTDSMPLLLSADEVMVCEVCEDDQTEYAQARTLDVARALERRGATPTAKVLTAHEGQVADALNTEANAFEADLIVAGCYGHSRIHEWLFGGVTRSLLHKPECFLLLSH
jgi:nucleotide-binding universal stress UspA family protein